MSKTIGLKSLFGIFFKINMFTFGGGYTIVPVIRDEFATRRRLIDEDVMLDIVAVAQSGPGPMAINTSILTGYKLRGLPGAFTCLLASVCPCFIIISLLYFAYSTVSHNPWVRSALSCMSGAISAVLFITVFNMAKNALKKHRIFGSLLFVNAFVLGYFLKINTVYIIIMSALIGLLTFSLVEDWKVR